MPTARTFRHRVSNSSRDPMRLVEPSTTERLPPQPRQPAGMTPRARASEPQSPQVRAMGKGKTPQSQPPSKPRHRAIRSPRPKARWMNGSVVYRTSGLHRRAKTRARRPSSLSPPRQRSPITRMKKRSWSTSSWKREGKFSIRASRHFRTGPGAPTIGQLSRSCNASCIPSKGVHVWLESLQWVIWLTSWNPFSRRSLKGDCHPVSPAGRTSTWPRQTRGDARTGSWRAPGRGRR